MLLATVGLASGSIIVKFIYREGVSPVTMLCLRMIIASAILWLLFVAIKDFRPYLRLESRRQFWGCVAVGATNAVSQLLYFLALTDLNPGLAQMIFACNPAIVVIIMLFFGERLTGLKISRLGLALLGLYFLTLVGSSGDKAVSFTSVALIVVCAVVYAAHLVLYQKLLSDTSSMTNTVYILSTMAVIYLVMELAQRGFAGVTNVSGVAWFWLVLMSLFATVVARLLMFTGLKLVGGTQVALTGVSEPLLVLLGSTLILGEQFSPGQWLGAGLVVTSLALAGLARSPQKKENIP
jgi:drug/metabolite transporter (DMT)-like permease